jgi:CelD/BcsL family acetyltransferase involved in cellulose biosynthesis
MTEEMESLFRALLAIEGAALDLLVDGDGIPVAAAFGFEADGVYYLYNSAYDPVAASASPGVVLIDRIVAHKIESGFRRLDFMKGDESYKYRLGAEARPLFAMEGVL